MKKQISDFWNRLKPGAFAEGLDIRIGDKIIIKRLELNQYQASVIRMGSTVATYRGTFRQVFEAAMKIADPLTLDAPRKVRLVVEGPKVN